MNKETILLLVAYTLCDQKRREDLSSLEPYRYTMLNFTIPPPKHVGNLATTRQSIRDLPLTLFTATCQWQCVVGRYGVRYTATGKEPEGTDHTYREGGRQQQEGRP